MTEVQQCNFCGAVVSLVHVHGHYQCPVCKTNALPCCDNDNCDTNNLLKEPNQQPAGEAIFQLQISNTKLQTN